jgi:type IV secretory pathway protease TraF
MDARSVSSVPAEAEIPVIDLVSPALKRISEKAETWRSVISEHVSLLGSAVGTNRKIGGSGKALVDWMKDQASVVTHL